MGSLGSLFPGFSGSSDRPSNVPRPLLGGPLLGRPLLGGNEGLLEVAPRTES